MSLTKLTSSQVTYKHGGTGSEVRNLGDKLRESVSVKDFGAVGDGVTDDTGAIQAALDAAKSVHFPAGTYKITSQIVGDANCSVIYGDGMYTTVISKEFSGNAMLIDTNGTVIENLGISGNGGTYTGAGIVPRGYNITIRKCRITDTAESCIYVPAAVGSNALAATYLTVDDCFLQPTNGNTTYSISGLGADDVGRPTHRTFSKISGGSSLVDFSGMNYAVMRDSLGTLIKFDANSSKIVLQGNRFTNSSSSLTIYGLDHVIDDNLFGFGAGQSLTIDSTCSGVFFGPNNNININSVGNQSVVQGRSASMQVANPDTVYSKNNSFSGDGIWSGSGTNPTIGNGACGVNYQQDGRLCTTYVDIVVGSTTNVGSGTYTFKLPFKALQGAQGIFTVKSSAGTYYTGMCIVGAGGTVATCFYAGATSAFASTSLALGAGAQIQMQVTYQIAAV